VTIDISRELDTLAVFGQDETMMPPAERPALLVADNVYSPIAEPSSATAANAHAGVPAAPGGYSEEFVAELQGKVNEYQSQLNNVESRLQSQDTSLQYAQAKLQEYESRLDQARLESGRLTQALVQAETRAAAQETSLQQSAEQVRQYEAALSQNSALAAERDQLEQSYRQRIDELEKLLAVQAEAEELIGAERQKLIGELAEQRRLLEETRRQLREMPGQEQQLQEATQAQLAELRKILGAEFARNAALVELARQERASAEAARQRLVEQTEVVIAEYRARHEKVRAQEEARFREERRLVEMERDFLRTATEAAHKAREQAEDMLRRAEEQATRLRSLASTEIDAIETEVAADMKRLRDITPRSSKSTDKAQGVGEAGESEQGQLRQEIEDQVHQLLTPNRTVPLTSRKILELQRQDIERIQKRTEEAKLAQRGIFELMVNKPADNEGSVAD